ncbi:MAG: tyrosine-type recombinase/integrase, partial [Lactococcus sp.]
MKWQEIIEEFLTDIQIRGYSATTVKNYRYKLINIQNYFLSKNIQLKNIKKNDIKLWVLFLQKSGKQASSVNIMINMLSQMFEYMIDEEYLLINPAKKINRLLEQHKVIYPLNDSEIKQLLRVAKINRSKHIAQRNVVLFTMLLECGLRVSEIVNLKNEDILENQIVIRNSKYNKDRAVAITKILKKEMIKYDRIKKSKYKDYDFEYYFVSYQLCKLDSKAIWTIMNTMQKQIKLRNVVRFSGHTLRHTYAYMQVRNGMDIYTLSLNMGHSQVSSTQKYLQTLKSDDFV